LRAALPIAALALCALAAGCGGGGSGSVDLRIGNLVPLRGDLAELGPAGRKAATVAVSEARRAARGSDVEVALRSADTETDDRIAEVRARQLVEDDDASCLVGDWASGGTFAVAGNVAVPDRVTLISPASTSFELSQLDDRGLVFRTAPSDDLQAVALAALAARSIGGARGRLLSISARDDAYGRRFSARLAAAWKRRGGRVQGPFAYDPGQVDHRADARRLVAGDPDAFAIIDFPQSFARLAPALLAGGRFEPDRLFVPDVMATADAGDYDIPPAALDGARGTLPGATAASREGAYFDRRFAASGLHPAAQAGFDAEAFDAVNLCFLSAIAAGSADGGAIASEVAAVSGPPGRRFGPQDLSAAVEALRRGGEIDYQGASGPLDLDSAGDPTVGVYRTYRYRGDRMSTGGRVVVRR
jgi:branched-chain amino acid transport system substrate-binding protein